MFYYLYVIVFYFYYIINIIHNVNLISKNITKYYIPKQRNYLIKLRKYNSSEFKL